MHRTAIGTRKTAIGRTQETAFRLPTTAATACLTMGLSDSSVPPPVRSGRKVFTGQDSESHLLPQSNGFLGAWSRKDSGMTEGIGRSVLPIGKTWR